ncbi:MAG: 16S rRNA (guanine(527)-N(7))-methyltransferase RsmG [Spirochaetales bacterium]|nr:16S rRNA (guanine(527)-N(7))-methyltransferase RsmG [Spirochaetales bacterium]
MKQLLESGLTELELGYQEADILSLSLFIREIERWNKNFNLVKATGDDLVVRHILDSLAGLPFFSNTQSDTTVLDIGSGAGFPGIPLSLFLSSCSFTLAERNNLRASFLNNIRALLPLSNVTVFEGDYRQTKNKFDIITFRAFTSLEKEIGHITEKLEPGGKIIAYKGKLDKTALELAIIRSYGLSGRIEPIRVPFLEEERHLLIVGGTDTQAPPQF